MEQRSIGRDAAVAMYDSQWWVGKTAREIAEFQLSTAELCLPFDLFHAAMEEAIGRPIFTHEFGLNADGLADELFKGAAHPTMEQILALIPADKRVLVVLEDHRTFDILNPQGQNQLAAGADEVLAWFKRRGSSNESLESVVQQMNKLEPGQDFMLPMGEGHVVMVRRSA